MGRFLVTSFLVTLACAPETVPVDLATDRAAPPPAIVPSTALPGRDLTLRVVGASPATTVRLVMGTAPGAGPCLPVLGGDCLGVAGATLIGGRRANAAGEVSWVFPVALTAPIGLSRAWQAVLDAGGTTVATPVLVTEVADPVDVCDSSGAGWNTPAAVWECEVLRLINEQRQQGAVDCGVHGVHSATHPLIMTEELQLAARVHAQWMSDNRTLSHASPGGPLGDTLIQRVEASGYLDWRRLEENIAQGGTSPAGTLQIWLRSDDHCANLMSPVVRDMGVGMVVGNTHNWWTAVFAQPR